MNMTLWSEELDILKTNKITIVGVLTAITLVIFILEAQIPPLVPIPGIKLGLANIITLIAVYAVGRREAFIILMLRIIIGSIYSGNMQSFIYSLAGGIMCYIVTVLLSFVLKNEFIWVVSIFGALAHIAGQLGAAYIITGVEQIIYYTPILIISAVITGTFTGVSAQGVYKQLKKITGRGGR